MPAAIKVGIVSLGCPKNLVDSEYICEQFGPAYAFVNDPAEAEIVVVNTCAFLTSAVEEAIETLLEFVEAGKKVICTGCLVSRYGRELLDEIPELVLVAGPGSYGRILEAYEQQTTYLAPRFDNVVSRSLVSTGASAYVKISEGCSNHCSFCLIPSLRGELLSKPEAEIIAECRRLLDSGVKELILIGQDLGSYGRDRGAKALPQLLEQLAGLAGLEWLRVMYIHPETLTAEMLALIGGHERICSYLDMPVQHVNDAVLQLMGRAGGTAAVREKVALVKQRGIWLRSTVMVGHPGEDAAAFEELLGFVAEGHFDHLGAFTFSAEEGTRSAALGDGIAPEVKQERYERIMAAQQAVSKQRLKALKGRRFKTLIEGYHPETELLLRGRTEFQAPEIDGFMVINEGGADAGTFATVEVAGSLDYDLVGRIV